MPSDKVTDSVSLFAKALLPIVVTVSGSVTVPRRPLLSKALSPIVVRPWLKWNSEI